MSQDNNRRKLKPNRYNKFEASENPAKDLDTYTDIPRRPQKRLSNGTNFHLNRKKMCYNSMHPPSTSVNLANNRLLKLKQSLQQDLKQRTKVEHNSQEIENSNSNDLSQTFNEPQTPEPSRKTIYKNLEKWASPNSNDSAGYSANQRLRRLKTVINESVTDTVKPKFNDSSGTPQKSVQETIVPKSSAEKSIPSPYSTSLPKTPQITSPDSASNSPYKINCKRKNSESTPNEDEYKSWKKYLVSPKTPVENVRKSIKDKAQSVPSLKHLKSPSNYSSRILKIKQKTEQINNSINNDSYSTVSERSDSKSFNDNINSPLDIRSPNWSNKINSNENLKSPVYVSERRTKTTRSPDLNIHSPGISLNESDFGNSYTKITASPISPTARLNKYKNTSRSQISESTSKNSNNKSATSAELTEHTPKKSVSVTNAELNNKIETHRSLSKNSLLKASSTSINHRLKLLKQNLYSELSKNKAVDKNSDSLNVSPQHRLSSNKSYSKNTSYTPFVTLNNYKTISVDKHKNSISITDFNNTKPKSSTKTVNTFKNSTPSELKISPGNVLTKELLSAINPPLPNNSADDFDGKMAMTASWIRSHQKFVEETSTKIQEEEVAEKTRLANETVCTVDDVEEMDWTNAEPDEDFPDTQQQPVESKPANKNVETQTQEAKVEDNDKYLCIVVDTNIFISDLTKVNDIVNLKVTGPMKPIVYIPWMVVTELDEMKDRSGNNSLKQNVYNAIKCINKWLSEENPRVKGQTIIDMGKQMHVGSSQDDKIIGTCLQANDTYESVILLSNDINLKNKAMINGIAVASGNEIIMKIMSKVSKNTKYQKILQKMSMLCSSIICECAKEAYGDVWLKMDMLSNPPWSLAECLKRFKKYWVAVFQEKLMKQFLNTVDKLQMLFDTTTHFCDDSDKYIEFVKLSLNICIFLKDIEEYRGSIENTINDITNIG